MRNIEIGPQHPLDPAPPSTSQSIASSDRDRCARQGNPELLLAEPMRGPLGDSQTSTSGLLCGHPRRSDDSKQSMGGAEASGAAEREVQLQQSSGTARQQQVDTQQAPQQLPAESFQPGSSDGSAAVSNQERQPPKVPRLRISVPADGNNAGAANMPVANAGAGSTESSASTLAADTDTRQLHCEARRRSGAPGGVSTEAAGVLESRSHGLTFVMSRCVLRAAEGSHWARRLLIEWVYGGLHTLSYDAVDSWSAVHDDVLDIRITYRV